MRSASGDAAGPIVHARGPLQSGRPVDVRLDVADALGVGLSLMAIAREGRMPAEAAEKYHRVGIEMVRAARVGR